MVSVSEAVAFIESDLARRVPPMGIYWYECESSRKAVRAELEATVHSCHLLLLIPETGFDNPNGFAADLVRLLETTRAVNAEAMQHVERENKAVAIVILSRTRLREPIIGSPVAMPDWLAYCGGRVVALAVQDVLSGADTGLGARAEDIVSLRRTLFELEGILLARLTQTVATGKNDAMALFSRLLGREEKTATFLVAAEEWHNKQTPMEYRAESHPKSTSLLGRLVSAVGATSPAQLPTFGADFFKALHLHNRVTAAAPEPFLAVVFRSTIKEFEGTRDQRQPRNMLLALFAGAQLVTAFHHASVYGTFPAAVMRAVIFDVRRALSGFKDVLANPL